MGEIKSFETLKKLRISERFEIFQVLVFDLDACFVPVRIKWCSPLFIFAFFSAEDPSSSDA